jgi:hypothetical protein
LTTDGKNRAIILTFAPVFFIWMNDRQHGFGEDSSEIAHVQHSLFILVIIVEITPLLNPEFLNARSKIN